MMKRIGRDVSIEGIRRVICRIEADDEEDATEESAGMYAPPSRNDFMFVIRRRDEADGERRIIGSGLLTGF
jgi:hypothetical protein